jgi:hypothetical protein
MKHWAESKIAALNTNDSFFTKLVAGEAVNRIR